MARRVRPDQDGRRVLELEVASREAAPRKGARYPPTSHVPVETSQGVRQDMAQAGGRSQAEERLCEKRRSLGSAAGGKPCTEGFLEIKLMSVRGVELVGEHD
jgi:hypothetical protein